MTFQISTLKSLLCKTRILLSFLVLPIVMAHGQNTMDQEVSLVGTWTFSAEPSFAKITAEDKDLMDSSPQLKSNVLNGYMGRVLIFNSDGSFSQMDGSGKRVSGSWNLQGQALTIRSLAGSTWIQQVTLVGLDHLVLTQMAKGEALPILPELHFTKNQ